jgi:hypothetical protein
VTKIIIKSAGRVYWDSADTNQIPLTFVIPVGEAVPEYMP